MSFESLYTLEVPPLPALDLSSARLENQLVSSIFLSFPLAANRSDAAEDHQQFESLSNHDAPAGVDPVLDKFISRASAPALAQSHGFDTTASFSVPQRDLDGEPDLDSPGPSQYRVRRSASTSSLSSIASSVWDESPRAPADRAFVRYRGSPPQPRLLDLATRDTNLSAPSELLEAIHEARHGDDSASALHTQHLAPVHPIHDVVRSLTLTATTGTSSEHFQWDADSASFQWAATVEHRRLALQLRRLVKEQAAMRASLEASTDDLDETDPAVPPSMMQAWIGSERIMGWSEHASDSVVRPFLETGALLRRIDDRVLTIHRTAATLCNEAPALAAALDTVLAWLKDELASHTATITDRIVGRGAASCAVLNAHAELQPCSALLKALGNLLSCGQPRLPPFRPMAWLGSTHATLSHLHAHLSASLASDAPDLCSAVLAYLLDSASLTWRQQIARWVGYPGFESDRTGELDDRIAAHRAASDANATHISHPWSGAVVDWSLDERGEEDIGYTLKPSAVPSFLPFRHARTFLEAGRALRLLKKAAPNDHPLVSQWSIRADADAPKTPLSLPTWHWSPSESPRQLEAVEERITHFKREIARWRRQKRAAASTASASAAASPFALDVRLPQLHSEGAAEVVHGGMALQDARDVSSGEDYFARMSQLFSALPGVLDATAAAKSSLDAKKQQQDNEADEDEVDEQGRLLLYLAEAACPPSRSQSISHVSFDRATQACLVAPFESWARLINMSLISVFFQDLGLGTYLETCKQFLLLGNALFERQVISSLFDVDQVSVLDEAGAKSARGRAVVAMNRRLTAEGVWPPNDSLLSSALNTAVIETVSSMRQAHQDRMARSHRHTGTEDAVSLAFKDLDERLSFAVVEPRSAASSSGSQKSGKNAPTWSDPSSIDALDWLTLSFHPPPLISPLLTQLAQSRYQRLWNLLLRIKRCKVAMRTAWQCTFKSTSAAFTFDFRTRSLMQQFRWELNHFLDTYGSFVNEIGIELHWNSFMQRLDRVRVEVSDELASRRTSAARAGDGQGESDEDLDDEALEEEEKAALMTSSLELKDVFSLARYHERVLDRMLSTCFLKSKQRGVLRVVHDLLQTVLDFAQLCVDFHTPASPSVETPTYDDFHRLHVYFRKRIDTLVHALAMLKDRRPSNLHPESHAEEAASGRDLGKRRQDVESEKARLAFDELEDLRRLDVDAAGRSTQGIDGDGASSVEVLLCRLNASGFYAELD